MDVTAAMRAGDPLERKDALMWSGPGAVEERSDLAAASTSVLVTGASRGEGKCSLPWWSFWVTYSLKSSSMSGRSGEEGALLSHEGMSLLDMTSE